MSAAALTLTGPFTQLITMQALAMHGPLQDDGLQIIQDGGIVTEQGYIKAIGSFSRLRQEFPAAITDAVPTPMVALPGFIDAHTHICFAGNRAPEFQLKLQGKSYVEIAQAGGGIWQTVQATRHATESELTELTAARLHNLLQKGVTTVEVKSGYGLSVAEELKMLRAINAARLMGPVSVVPTCLAAHTLPRDFYGSHRDYLELLLHDLLPQVAKENLSRRVDIFTESSAFGLADSRWYLQEAKKLGFELTVHADQFTPGGAMLAAEAGACSADHLEASDSTAITALAGASTVATVLPGASLGLGLPFAPARKLLDAGCCLAIASDWNPGSAPMGDLLTQASLLAIYQKLSFAETLAGITFRAAKALQYTDRGVLAPGYLAHFCAFPTADFRDLLYYQGAMQPTRVWC